MKFTDDINKNFVVKWSKALTDSNNAVTSGVFHAPAEEFITKIEDEAICGDCASKVYLPDGMLNSMSLDAFRQYMSF